MQAYEPGGIETSPSREASPSNDPNARPDEERCAQIDLALSNLIERMEHTGWNDVPAPTDTEAPAWNTRLVEARGEVQAVSQPVGGA